MGAAEAGEGTVFLNFRYKYGGSERHLGIVSLPPPPRVSDGMGPEPRHMLLLEAQYLECHTV